MIDAHQHFWKYDPVRDAWITQEMEVIRRNFMPDDLAPLLRQNNIKGCMAVQADQSEEETEFLLTLAGQFSFIKGVVGWVDLQADQVTERLNHYAQNKKLKGIRHILQAEAPGFLSNPKFLKGIKALKPCGLTYDILIRLHQLPEAVEFVKAFPDQPFVLDHLAKPNVKDKEFSNWSKSIASLAVFENVHCKLSGLITEADWKHWAPGDLTPYLDWVVKCFGVKRIMYGSDWPVCTLASSYHTQFSVLNNYLATFTDSEKSKIMSENAIQFYNL